MWREREKEFETNAEKMSIKVGRESCAVVRVAGGVVELYSGE